MSGVNPGDYYIVNSQTSPSGNVLSINFVGRRTPLIVSAATQFVTQRWTVSGDPGTLQYIVPVYDTTLQAGTAGNYVEALSGSDYTWYITPNGDGYQVTDKTKTHVWGINRAAEGEKVLVEKNTGESLQVWNFNPA
ncbi:hypothetical protein EV363DRAFT_1151010 [Boletus edulis]|jgi:hypothetical protein|uniref:CCL2-like lectin domain-containing protein n=1 Tax=Boletus edulis BED1 TaxID=1328754 RepID=A0AAD4BA53_BOLED|nr:hypothetical protein EV363DRAFT_1151010 [Boletus edulis]KAF8414525.1 hypothetical protein L210DRAFT_3513710 [Boletus edulis BED1]